MEILQIDCTQGARKEMLVRQLLEKLPTDERAAFIERFDQLGLEVELGEEESSRAHEAKANSVHGSNHVHGHSPCASKHEIPSDDETNRHYQDENAAEIRGAAESHRDNAHEHHSVEEVLAAIEALGLSERAQTSALGVYALLAQAEAKAHDVPVEQVHFHEVGNKFAIAHVVAACMLVDELDPTEVVATPITTGYGWVDCAHGRLAIPAPATANLLKGLPSRKGNVKGEFATPTGVAIVRYITDRFEE